MSQSVSLTGREVGFQSDEIIVTKTDPTGKITYANDLFVRVSGYEEEELLGSPHSLIRHPDMPRAVFRLLWDRIKGGEEIFAFVVNRCKNGDHYWVLAHVTPNFDQAGSIVGYHSSRRVAQPRALDAVRPLYRELCALEGGSPDRKAGLLQSSGRLEALVARQGFDNYDRFIMSMVR
jgi:PAS domain S-box-containing protein